MSNMSALSVIHFLFFIGDIALIVIILYKNPKAQLNRFCALIAAACAMWSLGYCFTHFTETTSSALFWINISSFGWVIFPVATLYFYLSLTGKQKIIKNKVLMIASTLCVVFFLYAQWSGNILGTVVMKSYGWTGIWSTSIYTYLLYAYYLATILFFFPLIYEYGRKVKTNREKIRARILQFTAIIGYSLAAIIDIVLPVLKITVVPQMADVFISIGSIGIVICITRFGLLDINPTTAAKQILETMTDALILLDLEGKIKQANPATLELLEYQENELINTDFYQITTTKKESKAFLKNAIHKGKNVNEESVLVTKTGKNIPVLISASVIKDNTNTVAGFVILARDITEHKRLEESIRYHASMIASVSDAIVSRDNQYRILSWNKAAEELFGWRAKEVIGKNILDVLKPVHLNATTKDIQVSLKKSGYWKGESIQTCKDGRKLNILDSVSVIKDERGENIGTVGLFKDITERKNIEQALKESEERFSKAFYSSPDAISISRISDGIFLEVNDSFLKDNGFAREEVIGKSAIELNLFQSDEQIDKVDRIVQSQERLDKEEFQFRNKSGELRTKLVSSEYISLGGEPCLLTVSTDITENQIIAEALRNEATKRRIFIEQSRDGMVVVNEDGGTVYECNQRFADMLGYTMEEMKHLTVFDWEVQHPHEQVVAMIRTVDDKGDHFETQHRRKDGTIYDVEISSNGVTFAGQKLVFCVCRDITERKRMENFLRESEEESRLQKELIERVLTTIPNAVFLLDNDLRIIMTNQAAFNILKTNKHKTVNSLLGKTLEIYELKQTLKEMIKSHENNTHVEFRRVVAERERLLNADIFAMPKDELLVVVSDITEEREKQERLYLTDRLASIGEMASGVAHELNNPLTSIVGLSSFLAEQPAPENIDEIKEDLNAINSEAKRCAAIVKNLLTFARQHRPTRQPLNAANIIEDVLKLRAYEHKANNIIVETKLQGNLPQIYADYFQLQQVFLNIILNAETAMIDTHRQGTLNITGESVDSVVRISFADNGPGIAKENLRLIFNPFFTTKEVGKGTGLGLSICYGIITSHDGKIYAKSEDGRGATFVVELPIYTP